MFVELLVQGRPGPALGLVRVMVIQIIYNNNNNSRARSMRTTAPAYARRLEKRQKDCAVVDQTKGNILGC